MTTGPWLARSMSTPQTLRPMDLAARMAVERSSGDIFTVSALPPRCRLERNSSSAPRRCMAATTLPFTTRARMSVPPASLMNSCTRMLTRAPRNASITDLAPRRVSASTTPMPWVPSRSLMTRGVGPASARTSSVCLGSCAKVVTGSPTPSRAKSCMERSLSRERPMPTDSFKGNTPIISNCRSTARP